MTGDRCWRRWPQRAHVLPVTLVLDDAACVQTLLC